MSKIRISREAIEEALKNHSQFFGWDKCPIPDFLEVEVEDVTDYMTRSKFPKIEEVELWNNPDEIPFREAVNELIRRENSRNTFAAKLKSLVPTNMTTTDNWEKRFEELRWLREENRMEDLNSYIRKVKFFIRNLLDAHAAEVREEVANELMDILPTGEVHAFDLIQAIEQYRQRLLTPPPPTA